MNTERDKFLTEAMGEYWVNIDYHNQNDFSTWEGFGKLWEWCKQQSWLGNFEYNYGGIKCIGVFADYMINPDKFADAVYNYLNK